MLATTIIDKQYGYEIIKIEEDDKCVILYAYKNMAIVLNGKKDEPYLVSTLSKDTIKMITNKNEYHMTIFDLLINSNGVKINPSNDIYHPSKIVLEAVKLHDKSKNHDEIYYTGKRIELNKKSETYDITFPDGMAISITLKAMINLYNMHKLIYCYMYDLFELDLDSENKVITYKIIDSMIKEHKNNNTYIIKLCDINLDNFDRYRLLSGFNTFRQTLSKMNITTYDCVMTIKDANLWVSTTLGNALDLFTGRKSKIKGCLEFEKEPGIGDEISCNITYDKYDKNMISIEVVIDGFKPLVYNIFTENDFRAEFSNAILESVKNGGNKN